MLADVGSWSGSVDRDGHSMGVLWPGTGVSTYPHVASLSDILGQEETQLTGVQANVPAQDAKTRTVPVYIAIFIFAQ